MIVCSLLIHLLELLFDFIEFEFLLFLTNMFKD